MASYYVVHSVSQDIIEADQAWVIDAASTQEAANDTSALDGYLFIFDVDEGDTYMITKTAELIS